MNKQELFEQVKIRRFPNKNYHAIWHNLKTIRLGKGVAEELDPEFAEFYDVGINTMCNAMCDFCLVPNTNILTDKGEVCIENIKENDLVFSYNEKSGDVELKPVDQLFIREYNSDIIEIVSENNQIIRLTPNHKVFTRNRGWVDAGNLQVYDELLQF